MTTIELERFHVQDPLHGAVACTALAPAGHDGEPLPLCIFLFGGGGSAELLAQLGPLFDAWWSSGALRPLRVATPGVDPYCFYLDDPERGLGWESFVRRRFLPHVRSRAARSPGTALVGISMGGQAALKLAFAEPREYRAVAAISPMIEPARHAQHVRPRNRYHYPPEVPQRLLGAGRDAELYRRDAPVVRALRGAQDLRESALGIYIDAAGEDALHAHDGAEYLHRTLWELDVAHDYRLRDRSDHAGPDMPRRLLEAFSWAAERLAPATQQAWSEDERTWLRWLDGQHGAPPSKPLDPSSALFPRVLRALLAEPRRRAAQEDPTFHRRYGLLEAIGLED